MKEKNPSYRFGEFQINLDGRVLLRNGQVVALTPKCFDTLAFLVANYGRLVEKEELINAIWPDSFVEEGNLSQQIYSLRRILGDDRNGNSFIQTVPRRGYKFIAAVTEETGIDLPGMNQSAERSGYWNSHTPFRSLKAFETEDGWLFFGRESETRDLLNRVSRFPVLVVVGNSGCGKSSLLRAGLIPALLQGPSSHSIAPSESWRIAVFRPSGSPFEYLAEVLAHQLAPELTLKEQIDFIANCRRKFPDDKEALRNAIAALVNLTAERDSGRPTHVLLLVDQFEELFTLTNNTETRNRYIDALLAAAKPRGSFATHLVLTLRADFYPQCLEHADLSLCLEANLYNVPRMGLEQLRESIHRRLQLASAHAEPGLIEVLLDEVGTEPGNLALLEHALGHLWDRRDTSRHTLTNRAYLEIGRLQGALGRYADTVYSNLGNDHLKLFAQKIFLELVHLGEDSSGSNANDTRRRVRKAELLSLGPVEEIEQLLALLASSRLISTTSSEQGTFVEVSHEALIREWLALREWLAVQRESLKLARRLRQAAEEWQSLKHDPGALLQGARLSQAQEWLSGSQGAPKLLHEFIQASATARDEVERKELVAQKKATVRLQWFSCALTLLLLSALGLVFYAYRLHLIEKSRVLAAHAEEIRSRDPGAALELAIRSLHTAKTEEARDAISKVFPQLIATLNHGAGVESVVFSSDGQRVLTASDDHTARVWSSKDGSLLATLAGHTDIILSAEFSADGQHIVTASADHTARIWDAANGSFIVSLEGHTNRLESAHFSPDGTKIVTASWDHTGRVWNSINGRLLSILRHDALVTEAIFSPDGKRILTTSLDHTARVWRGTDYSLLTTLTDQSAVSRGQFSPDGLRIVTCNWGNAARIWSSTDGHLLATLGHDARVTSVTFSPDGHLIATASIDHTARVWDSEHGTLLVTLQSHTSAVRHATFSPDGHFIVTDSDDLTAKVWNAFNGHMLATLQAPAGTILKAHDSTTVPFSSRFSPNGLYVVAALGDPSARVWNIGAAAVTVAVLRGKGPVFGACFSRNGRQILTANLDEGTRIWNPDDGRLLTKVEGVSLVVSDNQFSPDDQHIVTPVKDEAKIWNIADGRVLKTLRGHAALVLAAWFSSDGQRVATVGTDRTARLWNSGDGQLLISIKDSSNWRWPKIEFSADGKRVLIPSQDHTVGVWSSVDGRLLSRLAAHTDEILQAQFSPDGQRIVTASADHTARLWDSLDGQLLFTLKGHSGVVRNARFSPDGQNVVTSSNDKTARLWNTGDGRLLATLEGHDNEIRSVEFSPNGRYIVTTTSTPTTRLWDRFDGHLVTEFEGQSVVTPPGRAAQFSPDSKHMIISDGDRIVRLFDLAGGHLVAILQGHSDLIADIAFSPDGQRIVTSSYDQTARLWRVLTLADIEQIMWN